MHLPTRLHQHQLRDHHQLLQVVAMQERRPVSAAKARHRLHLLVPAQLDRPHLRDQHRRVREQPVPQHGQLPQDLGHHVQVRLPTGLDWQQLRVQRE